MSENGSQNGSMQVTDPGLKTDRYSRRGEVGITRAWDEYLEVEVCVPIIAVAHGGLNLACVSS